MQWYLKALKQYADFKGRAQRKEYWMFTLFNLIIMVVLQLVGGGGEGGLGDVLSGILAALLARGWDAGEALLAAVHLHGLAGDRVCAAQGLDSGLLADELAPAARACFNAWVLPPPGDAAQAAAE